MSIEYPAVSIPDAFWAARHNSKCYPGMPEWTGLIEGANCQQFAFEVLRHNGVHVPDFRSNELWEDTQFSLVVTDLRPLDLLLFNCTDEAWGAHVAIYLGGDKAVHLAKTIGVPIIWGLSDFFANPAYPVLIGAKRFRQSTGEAAASAVNAF